MTSRRKFLATMPGLSAAALLSPRPLQSRTAQSELTGSPTIREPLEENWGFKLDPEGSSDPQPFLSATAGWQTVVVPHSWQTLGGSPDYVGVAWYRLEIFAPEDWRSSFVRIEFEAVTHTAHVFLNGVPICQHVGKGYTAFTGDLSPKLSYGRNNTLLVRVDNSYSQAMLPRMKSYDWANDGGIIRPVSLLVTPRIFVERIEIDSAPDLERHTAEVNLRAIVRNTMAQPQTVRVLATLREEAATDGIREVEASAATVPALSTLVIPFPAAQIASPRLWHFDAPHLYVADVVLEAVHTSHTVRDNFGIRRFETRGAEFYLNGERVFLMGVERMAGSHPEFGMAEPTEWIDANHRDMKELNCVFTRVHWAQDRRVLDFCDRHGILMQEEVPAWGPETFDKTSDELQEQLEKNGIEQLREMLTRDRNHPAIVSWGLCNEVDGKNPRSRAFAHAIAAEARKLDASRLLTYASHTLDRPEGDMAGDFDFISTNEYYGSWAPGGPKDVYTHIDRIRKAFPGKPIVISEYGWCECQPQLPPGDEHRVEIVDGHTEVLRQFPEVAGAIYFDYNDYRTLAGDKGEGAFRQRVHGVVDLYANRKPSFEALRKQSSPIERLELRRLSDGYTLLLATRATLPAYTLRGYRVRWILYGYDGLPMEGRIDALPELPPGTSHTLTAKFKASGRLAVAVVRPTGFSVAMVEFTES